MKENDAIHPAIHGITQNMKSTIAKKRIRVTTILRIISSSPRFFGDLFGEQVYPIF